MAVVNSDFGPIRQKVGGLRFSMWKGVNVIARQPAEYNDAQTQTQVNNRAKITLLTRIGRILLGAVRVGFRSEAIGKSEFNVFTSRNYNEVDGGGGVGTIDPIAITVSHGPVKPSSNPTLANNATAGSVNVTIPDNADGITGLSSDILYIAWLNITTFEGGLIIPGKTRATAATMFTVALGAAQEGQAVTFYFFYKSASGSSTSDSLAVDHQA